MEKMTYVSCINDVLNGVALTDEHRDKLKALIERLNKPHAKSDKPTKAQLENEKLQQSIYDGMVANHKYTVSELIKNHPLLNGMSTQKVTPQLTALAERNLVKKSEDKRKTYYEKVELAD